jgi:hypothetical protein
MRSVRVRTLVGAIAIVATALLTACGSSSPTPPARASLRITLAPHGAGGPTTTWSVACPNAAHAADCARLLSTTGAFTLPKPKIACSMIYGGAQTLAVSGNVGNRRITYTTGRTNGCEIADYERDLALVAPFRPLP